MGTDQSHKAGTVRPGPKGQPGPISSPGQIDLIANSGDTIREAGQIDYENLPPWPGEEELRIQDFAILFPEGESPV